MRYVVYCVGWELDQYSEDDVPQGFVSPCYRVVAPDGTRRSVSADKLKDALDYLFEMAA